MSARRSARLASKSSTGSQDVGAGPGEPDLIYEEGSVQHANLRPRTPCTLLNRSGQKRKRGPCAIPSNPITGEDVDAEFGRSKEVDIQNEVFPHTPECLAQCKSPDGSSAFSPLSLENDSFLLALDKIENDEKNAEGSSEPIDVDSQCETVCNENCSQDVFGDDDDILDALPPTPQNVNQTPKRSPKISISQKRLAVDGNPEAKPGDAVGSLNEFQSAKDYFESEKALDEVKEPKPKRGRKRSTTAGEKKKNAGGQAKGAKEKKKKKAKFKLAFTNRKHARDLANSASNELSIQDLSYMTETEKLQLSSWGLPTSILNNYRNKGITTLFKWQLACLENAKVLEGRNLLYSAPTSAGKTLVSEILMIKRVLELGRKAIMILPFVSVAREKVYSLQSIFGDAGIRVEGFMGSVNPPGGFKAVDIAICTIEKANSLLNKLLEEDCLADLGTLVVDELHLIGDPHRGYLLELLLTKILYMTTVKNCNADNSLNMSERSLKRYQIQIIGMSATLPNLNVLAEWLNAELYVTNFRPVPLMERLKVEDKLYDENLVAVRDVKKETIPIQIAGDVDDIVYLTLETVLEGFSVLIFCPTKVLVEQTARRISSNFFHIGDPSNNFHPEIGARLRSCLDGNRIKSVLDQLKQCPGGADEELIKTIMFGIGYHHAGLTYENRDIVESAFKRGILKVIVATSTLSAGVNLPARRVLISTPLFNRNVLDTMTYRQMCGRAGRNGIDTEGESILICPANFKETGTQLFQGKMPIVKSALLGDSGSLTSSVKRALLEAIASGIASLTTDVTAYARCTFLFHSLDAGLYDSSELTSSQRQKEHTIDLVVEYLEAQDFIRKQQYEAEDRQDEYKPTQLGSACLAASFSPDDGIIVYKELSKARECFVLENELHIIYQVTPIYVSDQLRYISWNDYYKIYGELDLSEKKVADLVGISEVFIMKAMMIGSCSTIKTPKEMETLGIYQRFFAALALRDLVNEKTLDYVGNKFGLNKGVLQNLQQAASTFAGMVTAFCGRLGWANMELLLSQFQERLEFGVQRELCDLVRLDCLNGQRARILYDAGLKTVMELAAADPAQVEHILHKATPFNSNVHGGRESNIWMIGKESLTEAEAAQKIVHDAREFIQIELGCKGNIQFAFGANDAPTVKAIQQPDRVGHNESNRMNSMLQNDSENQKQLEKLSENDSTSGKSQKSNHRATESQSKCAPAEGENETSRDIQMEEFFTQRHQQQQEELEELPVPENGNLSDQALFEDSFPEIIAKEISALYNKHCEKSGEDQMPEKFSIEKEVEKVAVVKPQVQVRDSKTLVSRIQTDSYNYNRIDNVQRHHSTPLIASTSKQPHRFTLRQSELASPVRAVSPQVDNEQHFHETKKSDNLDINCVDLSRGILAEFDKNFSSCEDFFDCSMDADVGRENNDNVPELLRSKNVDDKVNGESEGLSDSVAEAMHALAHDTHFDSEELFPDDNKAASADSTPTNVVSYCSKPENGRSINLDDEDLILTQASWTSDKEVAKEENDVFEGSCSETESSSAWTDSHSSQIEAAEVDVHEFTVGKIKLTTRIVKSADVIPSAFFSNSGVIGLGLKLVSHKKPSASIARQGIGSRIISCKSGAVVNATLPPGETFHSLAMYGGNDTIWVLQWENENGLRVGGSRKVSAGNSSLIDTLGKIEKAHCAIALFESKEKIKNLLRHCGTSILDKLPPGEKIWDPRIAQWMWDFDDEDWNVSKRKLIEQYVTAEERNVSCSNLDKEAVDAFFAWKVISALREKLSSNGLWSHFISTEMPSIIPLLLMEMNGFGLDSMQLGKLKRVLQFKSALLELRAFQLAGRQFNLGSPKDIKQILFREIGLKQPKAKGTSKDVLLKLDHELPGIIVEWRKVTSALQKVVIPFQQEKNLETGRVHGYYSHFTVTGRVVMSEPSLQCIPRDFDILITYDSKEINELKNTVRIKFGSKLTALLQQLDSSAVDAYILNNIRQISMRNAFIPCSNDFLILTADYSQLELRILAHLSGDAKLLEALNKDTDVFTEIAAQWKNLPKSEISPTLRQEAKGIVYGVIYGMTHRTLAEQMEIDEREAYRFITQFMRTYPGVRAFIEKAPKLCQEKGYVETMTGRRRYLPLIHSRLPQEKAKAGRQAVNSQIQGSAADLVKAAMTRIYAILRSNYPKSAVPIEWNKLCKARRSSLSFQSNSSELDNLVFFPVLNLHDELIFEVRKTHLEEVAKVIKREMEFCIKLNVKLPVVIKTGDSWGTVKIYDVK